jgi:hypothetical protein
LLGSVWTCLGQLVANQAYHLPTNERELRILVNTLAEEIAQIIEEQDTITYDHLEAAGKRIISLRLALNQLAD